MRIKALALLGVIVTALAGTAGIPVVEPAAAASSGSPIGAFDRVSVGFDDFAVISGWATDPDAPGQPLDVHVYLGTRFVASVRTGEARPDVAAAVPGAGPSAGWSAEPSDFLLHDASFGSVLCAYGINTGAGTNSLLGCRRIEPPGPLDPAGALDLAVASPGLIQLRGWAADPDGDPTTRIRVYYDGRGVAEATAALPRPDVRSALGLSATSGFNLVLPIAPGVHDVCVYAQNTGSGFGNTTLGCAKRSIPGVQPPGAHDPRGSFDSVAAPVDESYLVRGWAFDPDTAGPVSVRLRTLYEGIIPNRFTLGNEIVRTGKPRADVQAAFPAAGPNSGWEGTIFRGGFTLQLPILACAYAVDVGPGTSRFLGCRNQFG